MNVIGYMQAFAENSQDHRFFITHQEHTELVSNISAFMDEKTSQVALPTMFQQMFKSMQLPPTPQRGQHTFTSRIQCRHRYALTLFSYFSLRKYLSFFHPADGAGLDSYKQTSQASKSRGYGNFPNSGHVILQDIVSLLLANLDYLIDYAECDTDKSQLWTYTYEGSAYIECEQEQPLVKRPMPSQFNIYDNMAECYRKVLKVTCDCLAQIRSKQHLSRVVSYLFSRVIQLPNLVEKFFASLDQEVLVDANPRYDLIYHVLVLGNAFSALGTIHATSIHSTQYTLYEKQQKTVEKREQMAQQQLSDFAGLIVRLVLIMFENVENQEMFLQDIVHTLMKQELKSLSPAQALNNDVDIQMQETFLYFVCQLMAPLYQNCMQISQSLNNANVDYFSYAGLLQSSPSMKRALNYCHEHSNYSTELLFKPLFDVLTGRVAELRMTANPISQAQLLAATLCRTKLPPNQLVGALDGGSGLIMVSDYLAVMLQSSKVDSEYLEQLSKQSKNQQFETFLGQQQCYTHTAILRALIQGQLGIFCDRNYLQFMLCSQFHVNERQLYDQVVENGVFSALHFVQLPKGSHRGQLDEIIRVEPAEEGERLCDIYGPEVVAKAMRTMNERVEQITHSFVSGTCFSVEQLSNLCRYGGDTRQNILEGYIATLEQVGWQMSNRVGYTDACRLLGCLVETNCCVSGRIGPHLNSSTWLLERFIQLGPPCHLAIIDCVAVYAINQPRGTSLVAEELFGATDQPFAFMERPSQALHEAIICCCAAMCASCQQLDIASTAQQLCAGQPGLAPERAEETVTAAMNIAGITSYVVLGATGGQPDATVLLGALHGLLWQRGTVEVSASCFGAAGAGYVVLDRLGRVRLALYTLCERYLAPVLATQVAAIVRRGVAGRTPTAQIDRFVRCQGDPMRTGAPTLSFIARGFLPAMTADILSKRYRFAARIYGPTELPTAPCGSAEAEAQCPQDVAEFPTMQPVDAQNYLAAAFLTPAALLGRIPSITMADIDSLREYSRGYDDCGLPGQQKHRYQQDHALELSLAASCVAFYAQSVLDAFADMRQACDDQLGDQVLYQRQEVHYFTKLLSVLLTTLQESDSYYIFSMTFLIAGFCRFIDYNLLHFSSSIKVGNQRVWHVDNDIALVDLYDLLINTFGQVYTRSISADLRSCSVIMLKYLLLLLQQRPIPPITAQQQFHVFKVSDGQLPHYSVSTCNSPAGATGRILPFGLDFILRIHQFNPFTKEQLSGILQYPFTNRCQISELMPFILNTSFDGTVQSIGASSIEFVNLLVECLVHNYNSYVAYQPFISESFIYMLYFHASYQNHLSGIIKSLYGGIQVFQLNIKFISLFKDLVYMFSAVIQTRDVTGFNSQDQQFTIELYFAIIKAIFTLAHNAELCEATTTERFIFFIAEHVEVRDMIELCEYYDEISDAQNTLGTSKRMLELNTGTLLALVLTKLSLNRRNYNYLAYFALEGANVRKLFSRENIEPCTYYAYMKHQFSTIEPRPETECGFSTAQKPLQRVSHYQYIVLQSLFLTSQLQYIDLFNQAVFSNAVHAIQLLLAISLKSGEDCPVFYQFLFRQDLSFSRFFQNYLFSVPISQARYQHQIEYDENNTDFNVDQQVSQQDLQRQRLVQNFVEQSVYQQSEQNMQQFSILRQKVENYKGRVQSFILFSLQAIILNCLIDKQCNQNQLGNMLLHFDNAINNSYTDEQQGEQPSKSNQFLQQYLLNVELSGAKHPAQLNNYTEQAQVLLKKYYSHLQNAIIVAVRAACDFTGTYLSNTQIEQGISSMVSLEEDDQQRQFQEFIISRLVYQMNNYSCFDTSVFDIQVYQQKWFTINHAVVVQKQVKNKAQYKNLQDCFPLMLEKVFDSFYGKNLETYINNLSQFCKDWVMGIGNDYNGLTQQVNMNGDEGGEKLMYLLSGAYGSINQFNMKFRRAIQSLFSQEYAENLIFQINGKQTEPDEDCGHLCHGNVFRQYDLSQQSFREINYETDGANQQQTYQLLHIFFRVLQQYISPEEMTRNLSSQNPEACKYLERHVITVHNQLLQSIIKMNHYFLGQYQSSRNMEMFVHKTLEMIKYLMNAKNSKQNIQDIYTTTLIMNAQKCPQMSILSICSEMLFCIHSADLVIPIQGLLLVVGKMIGQNQPKQAFELIQNKQPSFFYSLEQSSFDNIRKKLQIEKQANLTNTQLQLMQVEVFLEVCKQYQMEIPIKKMVQGYVDKFLAMYTNSRKDSAVTDVKQQGNESLNAEQKDI